MGICNIKTCCKDYEVIRTGENYHFQKEFLMPFLDIWKKCGNIYAQEYLIVCINNLVRNETKNIKLIRRTLYSNSNRLKKTKEGFHIIKLGENSKLCGKYSTNKKIYYIKNIFSKKCFHKIIKI